MKNLLYAMLLPLFVACNNDNDMQSSVLPTGIMTDASESYTVDAVSDGNIITFTITEPVDCSVESNQEWCVVNTQKQEAGLVVNLEVGNSQSNMERIAEIAISSPKVKDPLVVQIIQKPAFELKGFKEDVSPEGETYSFSVTSNASWSLTSESDWFTMDETSGDGNEEKTVTINISKNETGIIRVADIKYEDANGLSYIYKMYQTEPELTGKRIGDPGIKFNMTRIDPKYDVQMNEWIKAGVPSGIPDLQEQLSHVDKYFTVEDELSELKKYLEGRKNQKTVVVIKNGVYNFTSGLRAYSNQVIIGESRDGVEIHLSESKEANLSMYNGVNCGIRNLTVIGNWADYVPDPTKMSNILPELEGHRTIDMAGTEKCYLDNVRIVNSGSHPIWINPTQYHDGSYNTIRDVEIDGAYNKGRFCQGYFFIGGHHNLITGCKVTHIRHISLQNPTSKYNVLYKNDLTQEISFHFNDGGDNLIEHNKVVIPTTLANYNAIMGPWSYEHTVGGLNFVYRNRCLEENVGNKTPWSDNQLYIGPWDIVAGKPTDPERYANFRVTEGYSEPVGHTFYPVILE